MNNIKNVLILTKEYKCTLSSNTGGTGMFYYNLSHELKKKGINVFVFLISNKKFATTENGIHIYSIKDIFKDNPFLELLRSLTGKIKILEQFHFKLYHLEKKIISEKLTNWIKKNNFKFDVVETHDFDGLALSIPKELPYVIRCHGSWSVLEKYFGYKKVYKGRIFCEKLAFKYAKNIIAISKYNEKINKSLFNINNSKLIYNGIDENFYRPIFDSEIIPNSIFFLGNVSYEKGAETILTAFFIIKKMYPQASLHLIGNPNQYEVLVKEFDKEKSAKESIIFYGNRNAVEVVELINQAEVVCFPSKGENFSLSLLEVMAIQKPVICSSIESFKEIIQDYTNGIIADENNFQEKISLLFDNNNLKHKISLNARKLIESEFTLDKMTLETIDYYKKII
jgi:glycosyltransferase involved in cell wall biosynthesis